MTLLNYQVFKTVADQGSFRRAAEILGLTPSAVSHAVSAMETELGFAILNRSKSGVTLTSYGERLLPYVNGVLNSDESLQQVIAEFNGLKQGRIRIGWFFQCVYELDAAADAFLSGKISGHYNRTLSGNL